LERRCGEFRNAHQISYRANLTFCAQFFLDIWEELQDRAQHGGSIGTRTVASVAERTSRTVGASDADAADVGGLFDETASWYARLRERSEQIITETLVSNVRVALKPYRQM
jgi:hypothetical protein